MIGQLLAKALVGLVVKLITEKFLSHLLVESFRAWAKQTDNIYDDNVVEAVAESLGVEKEALVPAKLGNT